MAAPQVTGAVALCLEHTPGLSATQLRRLVLASADPPAPGTAPHRLGRGYLNLTALAAALGRDHPRSPEAEAAAMDRDHVIPLALDPARAVRELLYRPTGGLSSWLSGRFSIVARPGEPMREQLEVGDVVLRAVLGHPGARGECLVVAEPGLTRHRSSRPGHGSGWYARVAALGVVDGARPVRVLDHAGCVPPGQLLLRLHPHAPDRGSATRGQTIQQQTTRRQRMPRSTPGPGRAPPSRRPSVRGCWPRTSPGAPRPREARCGTCARTSSPTSPACTTSGNRTTCVRTATATAAAAGRLLAAANAALALAQQAGDADAQRTVRLTATSGYRGSDHQRRLWLGYFASKYYNRTRAARLGLPGGPHSDAALEYLLRSRKAGGYGVGGRIAAPGFSNHQGGIALDFWQQRTPGHGIANDSDDASRSRWRRSWFHGWMLTQAEIYGFQPITTEEWHWEYRPAATAPSEVTEHLGGALWTFASATLRRPVPVRHRVAVFSPKAARGQREVDVLVFAHGLIKGCTRPDPVPAGFVTDAPFSLGRVVHASGRPVVLVVPLLDWADPGGRDAFGRGRERWHLLGKPAVLNAVVAEALAEVGRVQGTSAPTVRELVIAGHSRAYDVLEPLAASRRDPAMRQGALAQLAQVWAFDTTYAGDVDAWTDWLALNPALRVHLFYRPGSRTGTVGDRFFDRRGDRLQVTRAKEGHCAVPATRLAQLMPRPAAATGGTEDHEAEESAVEASLDPDLSAVLGLAQEESDDQGFDDEGFDDEGFDDEGFDDEGDDHGWL